MGKIKVGIVGGAGYTGGELIRLLLNHPGVETAFIHSRSNAGKAVHVVHPDLLGETDVKFSAELDEDIDVLFLCLGHGESKKFLEETRLNEKTRIIDLTNDFRLAANRSAGSRNFLYGLPELQR